MEITGREEEAGMRKPVEVRNADIPLLADVSRLIEEIRQTEKDLEWAVENGLLKGYDESGLDLRPDRPVTRAELAAVLHRYDEMRRT